MGAEIVIECDYCREIVDAVCGEWADEVRNGRLYSGATTCWQCKDLVRDNGIISDRICPDKVDIISTERV